MVFRKIKLLYDLTRPLGAIPFLFCFLFGILDSNATIYLCLASSIIFVFLIFGPIHIINHYSDIEVDKKAVHKKDLDLSKQPFLTRKITKSGGILTSIVLWSLGLVGAYIINFYFFILSILGSILGIFYSLPPRAKGMPLFDVLFNSTGGSISYLAGWSLGDNPSNVPIFSMAWLFFLMASTYLFTVSVDYEQDKKTRTKTTVVFFGLNKTIKLSVSFFLISLIFFVLMFFNYELSYIYYLLIPFWVYSLYKSLPLLFKRIDKDFGIKIAEKGMKYGVIFCIIWLFLLYFTILVRMIW